MFVTPRYGDGALADLVPSVLGVLGVAGESDRVGLGLDRVRRVAILMIDGMGADLVAARRDIAPFLGGLPARTLTAGFPSTTVTSLASLGTGVPAGEHGLVGYLLAVPDHERLMNPLKWRLMGEGPKVDLLKEVVPEQFQPVATAFERAAADGITVTQVAPMYQAGSGLTRAALAEAVPAEFLVGRSRRRRGVRARRRRPVARVRLPRRPGYDRARSRPQLGGVGARTRPDRSDGPTDRRAAACGRGRDRHRGSRHGAG